MKKLVIFACILSGSATAFSQIEFDSFSDQNFTVSPAWTGNATNWNMMQNSDVAGGATNSFTLSLLGQNPAGSTYLSTPIYNWSLNQEWGIFIGRRTHPASASDQSYFWLYANEANLNSATVDGYRIAYGDDLANDHIRLEYIIDGAVNTTVITSLGTTANGINYIGFLVRVKRSAAGVWELFTSALPQVSGTGANANAIPNAANTPVNQGTGTQNSLVPASNGYIGVGALYSSTGNYQQQFDQIYFTASPANTPVITVSPVQLDSFISVIFVPSTTKSYVVQGTDLINDIVINRFNSEFECSLTNSPFVPAPNINLTPVAGVVPPTTIYVRMNATTFTPAPMIFENIPHTSSGAVSKYVAATGNALEIEPTVQSTISFGTRTNNSIEVNVAHGNGFEMLVVKESAPVDFVPRDAYTYQYPGVAGTYGITSPGNGNYIVASSGQAWPGPLTVTGLAPGKTYYFAIYNFNIGLLPGPNGDAYGSENYLLPGATGSTFTLSNPLPIIINYIKGTKQGSKHVLNWKVTCISSPRVTMVLERSADSRNFTAITSITADAIRCDQPFDYTDTDPLKGVNYYRLKMTDADGKVSYSSIVALLNAVKGFDIISIAPNPVVTDNFKLNVASAQAGKMELSIFDMQDRLVNRHALLVISGFNNLPVSVNTLARGSYILKASLGNDVPQVIQFVKH